VFVLLAGPVLAVACGDDSSGPGGVAATAPAGTASGAITVSAAASLTEAFGEIGSDFEAANPDATVAFNFGSSGTLATQIQQGAPADTFASADEDDMDELVAARLVEGDPTVFARNELVIVTEPGNPEGVETLEDLAGLDVVSLCGDTVPCGRYAADILQTAGVTIPESRLTRGQDAKATLGAVTTGDADAGIVYVTDAKTAGNAVATVAIPAAQNAIATYPIATLRASGNDATSRAFVEFVTSSSGRTTLRGYGFLPPP
jgi:molybdate transport system substrate-binding protein